MESVETGYNFIPNCLMSKMPYFSIRHILSSGKYDISHFMSCCFKDKKLYSLL